MFSRQHVMVLLLTGPFIDFSAPGAAKCTPIYKTPNPYAADGERPIFFICDPVHLLKTARNNWENSFWRNKTRKLRNNGMWITWLQLKERKKYFISDQTLEGLQICVNSFVEVVQFSLQIAGVSY